MFKKASSILLCILATLGSNAQKDSLARADGFFLSISCGRTIPFGNFRAYLGDINAGPPISGIGYKGEFMYSPYRPFFGITCLYLRTLNATPPLNVQQFYPANNHSGLGGGSSVESFSYWAGNWITDNLFVGIALQPFWGRIKLRFKASVGCQQVKTPEVRSAAAGWSWSISSGQKWWSSSMREEPITSRGIVYQGGVDLRANIVSGFGLMASIDVLNSVVNLKSTSRVVQKNITYRTWMLGLTYSIK